MTTRTQNTKQGASQGNTAFVFGYRQRRSEDYNFYDKANYDYEKLISLSDIDDAWEAYNGETSVRTEAPDTPFQNKTEYYTYHVPVRFDKFLEAIGCVGRPVKKG